MAADYTPWLFVPNLASAFFFFGVWLIYRRGDAKRLRDAAAIGVTLGIIFLAHTVPALLLSAIVTTTALGERGLKPRVLGWLAVVAGTQLLVDMVFLGPLLLHYHLHIVNSVAGAWTDPLLDSYNLFRKTAVINIPGVLALGAAWLLRHRAPFNRRTAIILLTWIGVCGAFLLRYATCTTLRAGGTVCRTFIIPAHHFHFYLQAAWAFVIGHILWHSVRLYWHSSTNEQLRLRKGLAIATCSIGLIFVGGFGLFMRPYDVEARARTWEEGKKFDSSTYRWLLANTRPHDLFVTQIQTPPLEEPATDTVMAAGRRLVAAPELHSNPYLDWHERDERRRRYLAAALIPIASAEQDLCAFRAEAGPDADAWFALPNSVVVSAAQLQPAYRSAYLTIYRITSNCDLPARPTH
jgi:hypothetical protein